MTTQELYEQVLRYAKDSRIPTRRLNQAYDAYITSAYKDTLGGVQNSNYALTEDMFQALHAVDKFKGTDLDSVINNRKTLKKLFKDSDLSVDEQQAVLRYFKRHNKNLASVNPQLTPSQEDELRIIQQVAQNSNPQPSGLQNVQQPKSPVNPNDIVVSNVDLFDPNDLIVNEYGNAINLKNSRGRPSSLAKSYNILKNANIVGPNPKQPVAQQNTQQNIQQNVQQDVNNIQQRAPYTKPNIGLVEHFDNLQQQNTQHPSPQEILSHVKSSNNPQPNFNSDNSRDPNPQHQQQIPLQDLAKGRQRAAPNGAEQVDVEILEQGQGYNPNNANNANYRPNFTWGAQNTQQNTPTGNNTMYGTAAGGPPPGGPPGPGGPGDLTGMFNRLKQGNLAGPYSKQLNTMAALGQGIGAISNVSKIGQGASNLSDLKGQILNSYSAANAPYYNLDPSQMAKIRRLQRGYSDADKPGIGDAISNIGTNLPSILMQAGMGYLSGGAPGAIINGVGGLVNSGLEGVNKKQQQKAAELESLYGSLMQANASINNRRMMQQPYIY